MDGRAILLVEDNPDDALLALRALRKNNVMNDVVIAKDGVEALEYLFGSGPYSSKSAEPAPLMVLLDLKLPRIDGLQVLKILRADKRTQLLPVVILTSSDEEQDIAGGYKLGANSYVRKPVDFVEFVEAVRSLGLYWLVLNVPPPAQGAPKGAIE